MSNMDRAKMYEDEHTRTPLNLDEIVQQVAALTISQVAQMTSKELSAIFPKYESGEFRILQHREIWEKLYELELNLPQDCREYWEKVRILSGIRIDGMMV